MVTENKYWILELRQSWAGERAVAGVCFVCDKGPVFNFLINGALGGFYNLSALGA